MISFHFSKMRNSSRSSSSVIKSANVKSDISANSQRMKEHALGDYSLTLDPHDNSLESLQEPLLSSISQPTSEHTLLSTINQNQRRNTFTSPRIRCLTEDDYSNSNNNNDSSTNLRINNRQESRLLDRQGTFCQSRGRWSVQNISRDQALTYYQDERSINNNLRRRNTTSSTTPMPGGRETQQQPARRRLPRHKILWTSWFYSLAYQRTFVLMFILFFVYTAMVFIFAFIYLGVSVLGEQITVNPDGSTSQLPFCSMDIHNHMEALYFSLSTMTTIGYGVSDYYFGGCWTPLLLVLAQVCCAITFDAVAIGVLFQRISRGHNRSKTIVLSDQAVVRRVNDQLYLMFRVGELRHHFLLEATVRAYCLGHERCRVETINNSIESNEDDGNSDINNNNNDDHNTTVETTHFVTKPLALLHQNSASPYILMSLPQVVVHRIDVNTSPLIPRRPWCDVHGVWHPPAVSNNENRTPNDNDSKGHHNVDLNNTDRHQYEQHHNNLQVERWLNELSSCQDYWQDRELEIVVLVEGTDELTGATIQTRHSYTYENIAWNHRFKPCILPSHADSLLSLRLAHGNRVPKCVVDFALFHDTEPAPLNSLEDPYIRS